jgi:hypothetical protein
MSSVRPGKCLAAWLPHAYTWPAAAEKLTFTKDSAFDPRPGWTAFYVAFARAQQRQRHRQHVLRDELGAAVVLVERVDELAVGEGLGAPLGGDRGRGRSEFFAR